MLNCALAALPCVSVAVQVTVVVPIANVLPEAGRQLSEATASSGSVAVTWNETLAPVGAVASVEIGEGTLIVGDVASNPGSAYERNESSEPTKIIPCAIAGDEKLMMSGVEAVHSGAHTFGTPVHPVAPAASNA